MAERPRVTNALLLMLAFPALVAFQLLLIWLDAPRGILAPVAIVTWFGGPVLLLVGVFMLWPKGKWGVLPGTAAGKVSLWLLGAFLASLVAFFVALAAELGPDSPDEFFDNLYLAIPGLAMAGFAMAAAVVAAFALFFRHERSLVLVGTLTFGAIVLTFTLGEIGGHEEPGGERRQTATPTVTAVRSASPATTAPASSATQTPPPTTAPASTPQTPPAGNSHSNATATRTADGVLVSFDYAYNSDPPRVTITAITVTALGADRKPLAGVEPVVLPIGRGSGHREVLLSLSEAQRAALREVSVCFTAAGNPDLGCALVSVKD